MTRRTVNADTPTTSRNEQNLLKLDAMFQRELKQLNALQFHQRQRLYCKYKERLEELATLVTAEHAFEPDKWEAG